MSNVANLSFQAGKWIADFRGSVLAASPNKNYVVDNIRNGRCTKALRVNVTDVREIGTMINEVETQPTEKFDINERFDFLADFVNMVANRATTSLVVSGEGGLGKTFTVQSTLAKSGLKNVPELENNGFATPQSKIYTVVKGYSTAKGLYRTLYENRNKLVIFDDCDSILRDPVALNILKAALDSYSTRTVSWNAESIGDNDLPKSFEFKGGIIFISNLQIFKIDQAIRSRAICVDLSMTTQQKIERMRSIISSPTFMPEFSIENKQSALTFLEKNQNNTKDLNFRTLITTVKLASSGPNWERRAEYFLATN